jgi:hypothetical protein
MGFVRKFAKNLFGFLFSLSLVIAILDNSLIQFTDYSAIKPTVSNLIVEQIKGSIPEEQLSTTYTGLKTLCQHQDTIEIPLFPENVPIENVTVSCSELASTSQESFLNLVSNKMFDNIYYKNYSCEFINCLRNVTENYLVIMSSHANNFFKSIQVFAWITAGVFGLAFFLVIETLADKFKSIGISLLTTSILFFVMVYVIQYIMPPSNLFGGLTVKATEAIDQIIKPLFDSMTMSYIVILIVGIVFTAIGFILAYKKSKEKPKE